VALVCAVGFTQVWFQFCCHVLELYCSTVLVVANDADVVHHRQVVLIEANVDALALGGRQLLHGSIVLIGGDVFGQITHSPCPVVVS
jgi:hypothetical protein